MYFPYLRGRQFELLAIRELAENNLLGHSVIPIIEPVKLSSTLVSTIKSFVKTENQIAIIHNPAVGDFSADMRNEERSLHKSEFVDLFRNQYLIKSHIINSNSKEQLRFWDERGIKKTDWLVINNDRDYLDLYEQEFLGLSPKYVLIPDESTYRRKIRTNRVLLDDKFDKKARNVDYSRITDEFFSDDHLFYKEDGFEGFSDFSIIGKGFLEAGFAPHAVAIHLVYFGKDNELRISHFVSDSNEDITNPAKKFYEAVSKIASWYKSVNLPITFGLETLLGHYKNQTYPGLGSLKKLTIMHHLELIGKYLDSKE